MSFVKPRPWSRRRFMAHSAAAAASLAAAGTLQGAAQTAARPVERNFKKSLKIGMVQIEGSLRDKFMALKELGYDGVELNSPNSLDPDEVLRARDDSGLQIPGVVDSIHWQQTLSHPDAAVREQGRKGLETALHDCRLYGGSTVLLVPAVVNREVSYQDAYRRSQEQIQQALPLCEELGVRIALENVWNHFLLSPVEAARYLDELKSPWVGWYFDVGNIVNYGWPEHWVRALGPRIFKLDIKEFSRKRRDNEGLWKGFQVKLLEGDCDWPLVMKALDDTGYFKQDGGGWGSAEVGGGNRERLADIAARMDRIFAS